MSDRIEPRKPAVKAVRTAARSFSRQALALDRIFTCAVLVSEPGTPNFHQDMRMEKEGNADLSGEPRTAIRGKTEEKMRNSSRQTIESGDWIARPPASPPYPGLRSRERRKGEDGNAKERKKSQIRASKLLKVKILPHDQ